MCYINRFILVFLIMAFSTLSAPNAFTEDSPKNRIDYWANNPKAAHGTTKHL